jgi:hypothetical protein
MKAVVFHAGDTPGSPILWAEIWWLHTCGIATLFLIVVQTVTGIFLAFYYVPSPEHAHQSVSQITSQLEFGWLLRGIHKWGASLVIVFAGLHWFGSSTGPPTVRRSRMRRCRRRLSAPTGLRGSGLRGVPHRGEPAARAVRI